MSLGSLIVNGGTFKIMLIELHHGIIELTASRSIVDGSFTVSPDDPYEIYGYDGTLIARGALHLPSGALTTVGEPAKPARMTVIIPIGVIGKELA